MPMPKYGQKKDRNQSEIVQALRKVGATVFNLGYPLDLLVGFKGVNYLVEIKTDTGTDTQDQLFFYGTWRGQSVKVKTVAEALNLLGVDYK